MSIIISIAVALILFSLLVMVHEFGHFAVAKAVGVRVNEFAIGMGPKIFQRQKGETKYSLRAFPIGGFVAMEGEDEESDDLRSFNRKKPWQKFLVIVAGPAMNFIAALLILIVLFMFIGTSYTTLVTEVNPDPGSVAYAIGLKPGDEIKTVNGIPIDNGNQIPEAIQQVKDNTFTIEVQRNNEILFLESSIKENATSPLGFTVGRNHRLTEAMVNGGKMCKVLVVEMVNYLGQLIRGQGSLDDVVGPIGIVSVVNDTLKVGMQNVAYLAALLSLNLGLINLFPFPALDGGRLVFIVIRKFAGKAISDELEGKFHFIGIMLLFALTIFIALKDVNTFIL